MKEKDLRNISILCSLFGLVILFFVSKNLESVRTDIGDITIDDVGKRLRVCGNITSLHFSKGHVFLDLQDSTDSIDITVFNSTKTDIQFERNQQICVLGTVTEYKSNLEIIADKVEE